MLAGIGLAASYTFYGACAVISFFLVKSLVRETKGKELEEMEGWELPSSAGDAEVATAELG
jgi:SP family sugar:H+ symporter-like MFS transporter